jgi:hypothetical protein
MPRYFCVASRRDGKYMLKIVDLASVGMDRGRIW